MVPVTPEQRARNLAAERRRWEQLMKTKQANPQAANQRATIQRPAVAAPAESEARRVLAIARGEVVRSPLADAQAQAEVQRILAAHRRLVAGAS